MNPGPHARNSLRWLPVVPYAARRSCVQVDGFVHRLQNTTHSQATIIVLFAISDDLGYAVRW